MSKSLAFLLAMACCLLIALSAERDAIGQAFPLANATVVSAEFKAKGIVYDAERNWLWITVGSEGGTELGNRLVALDPQTLSVVSKLLIGSEPAALDISTNSRRLFVGINGAAAMRTYDIPSNTRGPLIPLTNGSGSPELAIAQDFAVVPDSLQNVIVSKDDITSSATGEISSVYGSSITGTVNYTYGPTSIVFTGPSTMVGSDGYTSAASLFRFRLNGTNVAQEAVADGLAGSRLESAGGLVFSTGGPVIDPVTMTILGTMTGLVSRMSVEPVDGGAFVYYFGNGQLYLYETDSFLRIGSVNLAANTGTADGIHLVRAGLNRLAYVDEIGRVGVISNIPVAAEVPSKFIMPGTNGDDVAEYDAASGILVINGLPLDLSGYSRVVFDGGLGNDQLFVTGIPGSRDFAYLDRTRIGLDTQAGFFAGLGCEEIEFEADDITDFAAVWDSAGNDQWSSNPYLGTMTSQISTLRVRGRAEVYFFSTAGVDRAEIAGTSRNDRFYGSLDTGIMLLSSSDYSLSLSRVARVSVNAASGSDDRASLVDSHLNDEFFADRDYTRFYNDVYDIRTRGFDSITANADKSGKDRGILKKSGGTLFQDGTNNLVFGPGYRNNARKFESIFILE